MIRLIPAQGTCAYYADHIIGPPFTASTRAANLFEKIFHRNAPVGRKNIKGISNRSNRSQSTAANSDAESLRRQCTGRALPNHGQKNASISWLQQHATTSSSRPMIDATGNANLLSMSTSHERENPQSSLFTEDYLAQIRYDQLFLEPNRTSSVASQFVEERTCIVSPTSFQACVYTCC